MVNIRALVWERKKDINYLPFQCKCSNKKKLIMENPHMGNPMTHEETEIKNINYSLKSYC